MLYIIYTIYIVVCLVGTNMCLHLLPRYSREITANVFSRINKKTNHISAITVKKV